MNAYAGWNLVTTRRAVALIALILGATFALATEARAGKDFYIDVYNQTDTKLKLLGGANDCWYVNDLGEGSAPVVSPGEHKVVNSESKNSGSCYERSKVQNLELSFLRNGSYPGPYNGATISTDAMRYNINDSGSWDLWDDGDSAKVAVRGIPRGWYPFNINTLGKQDGLPRGMFCVKASRLNAQTFDLYVKSGADCIHNNGPTQSHLPKASVSKAKRAKAGPGKVGEGQDTIFQLLQTAEFACGATRPYQYWGYEQCNYASNADYWNLDNLTSDIKEVKPDGDAQVVGRWNQVASQTFSNDTGGQGKQSWEFSLKKGFEEENETHRAIKVGAKLSFEKSWKLTGIKAGFEVEVEGEWGEQKATRTSTEKEVKQGGEIEVPEKKKVRLVIKQKQASLATNYFADLTTGKDGLAQPIKTPAARPLGINASRNHPCIGYIGAGSPNSIRKLSDYAYSQGMTPVDPNLSAESKYFLWAGPGFSATNTEAARCPGFPDGFPAAFAFKGMATFKANAAGPTDAASGFAPGLPELRICAYDNGGDTPHTLQAGDDDPCKVGSAPTADEFGALIEGAETAANGPVLGDPDGSYIQAGGAVRTPEGDLREYQGQQGDDIMNGTDEPELFRGGDGVDILYGRDGADQLHGEFGNDTLQGGDGNDMLRDDDGHNSLSGGKGDDKLYSAKGATGGLYGGKGDDALTLKGRSRVSLLGGVGDDKYRLLDGARGSGVVELQGGGFDTVRTESDANLTLNVERLEAIGKKGLKLNGNEGDNWIIGGPGRDRLGGGRGSDLLKGKGGRDELILQPYGLDLAIGGPGADRFVVRGVGPLGTVTARRKRVGARSAHLIKDLNVQKGDRIVLHRKDYNRGLRKARHGKVTYGRKAKGKRPQFVFSRRSHLLSYDSDGTGPKPAVVISRIAKKKHIPLEAIQVK